MIAYVFPGQGEQRKGMGGNLFDHFKEITEKADRILGFSIKQLCLEDSQNLLNDTKYSQPALYTVCALNYLKYIEENTSRPDYLLGHSLGEYTALFAAGAFDFETGLMLVKKRGELMALANGGAMAAIIGLTQDQVKSILEINNLDSIDIANINTPTQIVISGPKDDIYNSKSAFERHNNLKAFIPLKTSGAFHSRYMKNAQDEFIKFIENFNFSELKVPVISNVYARPYTQSQIKETLISQITSTVKWCESIRYLLGKGVIQFKEFGVGKVLTNMIEKIKNESEPLIIDESYERSKTPENNYLNSTKFQILPTSLGSLEFKNEYNLKYAYLSGAMYGGIASSKMVIRMGKAGMMGFLGTGGMDIETIEKNILQIKSELNNGEAFGMNLLFNPYNTKLEEETIDLYLKHEIRNIEASAYLAVTPAIIRYVAKGLHLSDDGTIINKNRIIAKISRPEVAESFISPAPLRIVQKLVAENKITPLEAELLRNVPLSYDICVESDSGGHTDGGVALSLFPAILKLRDRIMEKYKYKKKIRVGAAGGIGTPESAAAAFILGADFITTGSINQCTVEADTSETAKDLLQQMNVQDTEYAPAGDMFAMGSKIQALKKGVFFPSRANKLYDLYKQFNSIDEIDERTKKQIQEKYFKKSFEEVYSEIKLKLPDTEIKKAEQNPKYKMGLIFSWYFKYSIQLAKEGKPENKVDYQIHCGPALGAFNQMVLGTEFENWRNRHVDEIALLIMEGTAKYLTKKFSQLIF